MVSSQKSSGSTNSKLNIGLYYDLYTDLVFANVGDQIDKWTLNDMSIFWLKLQNKQAVDRYIANPSTDKSGKVQPFKYPF
jgi:hypothetical protein